MAGLRWATLVALVASILTGFGWYESAPPLVEQLTKRREALAAELSGAPTMPVSETATSASPTPTSVGLTSTDAASVTATTFAESPSVTPTPTATETIDPSETPFQTETPTPIVVITFTPTTQPTETPTVDPDLPDLSDEIDAIDAVSSGNVDQGGGRVSTGDGRVVIDFPAGAVSEPLVVNVTRRHPLSYRAPVPDFPLASVWEFEAFAGDGTQIHQFASELTFRIRFSDRELGGRDPATLLFWTLNDETGEWSALPSQVNAEARLLVVHADHFSTDAATANRIIDSAPLLDGKNTNLHTGSASLDIPISVPPGRGGLAPDLHLSYDSGRLGEMKQYTDLSSWAGAGWEISTGSIQFNPPITSGCSSGSAFCNQGPYRITLDLGGFGGELFREGGAYTAYNLAGPWYVASNPYLRVDHACSNIDCPFVLTDQHGTKYSFGVNDNSRRWLCTGGSTCGTRQYYRFDLEKIEDTLGNTVDFTYWQQFKWTQCDGNNHGCIPTYVISSYPASITYNGGQTRVEFNREYDSGGCVFDTTAGQIAYCIESRLDAPLEHQYQCFENLHYIPPKSVESSRLNNIDVKVKDANGVHQRLKKYAFTYTTTPFDPHEGGAVCGPPTAGAVRLNSIAIRDRNDAASLTHMTFGYTDKTFGWVRPGLVLDSFTRPHLTHANNGFGGSIDFAYVLKEKSGVVEAHWTRNVVSSETHSGGAGQPPVVRTFDYGNGPDENIWENPYLSVEAPFPDYFHSGYRGFQKVTESDAVGNTTTHTFFTTNLGGGWYDEVRSGREINATTKDAAGNTWQSVATDWVVRPVAADDAGYRYCSSNCGAPNPDPTYTPTATPTASPTPPVGQQTIKHANFVFAASETTTLRDGQQLKTNYTYDDGCPSTPCYGLLTRVDAVGDPNASPNQAQVWTNSAWNKDTTAWVFTKQYEEQVDPNNGNALLSRTNFYYDGAKTRNPSPLPSPGRGLLTAKSTQLNTITTPEYSTTYSVYDQWGNVTAQSIPTLLRPEDQTPPGGPNYGWVPTPVATSTTAYDSSFHLYPSSSTNAVGQMTTYTTYDYILGKPTRIDEPTGHSTWINYDAFGRITKSWDNLDSQTYPTVEFVYAWGTVPNSTKISQRVNHLTTNTRTDTTCMDGFGREIEKRSQYKGSYLASARTDYNARGLVAARSNPTDYSPTSSDCTATAYDISTYDRTAYAYDPLGNVTTTTAIGTGVSSQTVAEYKGLETTFCDENFNKTRRVSNTNARTLTVYEPAATSTSCAATVASTSTVYTHDKLGRLSQVDDALLNRTTIGYDLGGRKTSMDDPDMGDWTYGYDAAGNLTSQKDARNITTTLAYDTLQRLQGKTYSNGDPSVSFTYDAYPAGSSFCSGSAADTAKGRMVRMTDAAGEQRSCYDARGRAVATRRSMDSVDYDMSYIFDALGQVKQVTYPDGDVVAYTASASGNITGMASDVDGAVSTYAAQTLLSGANPAPFGGLLSLARGNGQTTSYTYDFRNRLKTIQTGTVQDLTLTYDDASNVKTVTDNMGTPETVTYAYDYLNRLTGATGFSGGLTASYQYNAIGNLLTKQEGGSSITLTYPGSGIASTRPHAVIETTGTLAERMTYDANGNMKWSGDTAYDYDDENRVRTIIRTQELSSGLRCIKLVSPGTGNISVGDQAALASRVGTTKVPNTPNGNGHYYDASYDINADGTINPGDQNRMSAAFGTPCPTSIYRYLYDGTGTVIKRQKFDFGIVAATPVETIVYIGGVFEKNAGTGAIKKYYSALGRSIAIRDVPTGSGQGTLTYPLTDHLGSTVDTLDATGVSVASARYWPFGATRSGSITATDQKYTGQREEPGDPALGIYNYKARFYSPVLGRFLSVDPVVPATGDPQAWNPYAYVRNNPLGYTDPSGMRWIHEIEAAEEHHDLVTTLNYLAQVEENRVATDLAAAVYAQNAISDCFSGSCSLPAAPAGVAPTLSNSDMAHIVFGAVGVVNPAGDIADLLLYAAEGDAVGAGMSGVGLVPLAGDALKYGFKFGDEGAEIGVEASRWAHMTDLHTTRAGMGAAELAAASKAAGKSMFANPAELPGLIAAASRVSPVRQAGGNYERIVVASHTVGYDVYARQQTEVYTVITDANNNLMTAFPGIPQRN